MDQLYESSNHHESIANLVGLVKILVNNVRRSRKSNKNEFTEEYFKANQNSLASDSKTERVRQIINFAFVVHIYGIIDDRTTVMFNRHLLKTFC